METRIGTDQRNPCLQYRQPAIQTLRRTARRAAAGLFALRQPFHFRPQINPAARIRAGARTEVPAADVGVQGGGTDAEQGAGVAGRDQFWTGIIGYGVQ